MAAATQDLELFVRDALQRGESRESIEAVLLGAGWPAEQVQGALAAYAAVDFPVPVPRPRPAVSAREAFLYLVYFSTLYTAVWAFANLLFDMINLAFPDATERGWDIVGDGESMRWSVAAIVASFPVFLFVASRIDRDVARDPVRHRSPVRRGLTYLTLFFAVGAMVTDAAVLLYTLLGGELTVRFVLKVIAAALLSGAVLGYFLRDLRNQEPAPQGARNPKSPTGRQLLVSAALVMAVAAVAAIWSTGSPWERRKVRIDERRVEQLGSLEIAVHAYYLKHGALPDDLQVVANQPGVVLPLADPVTGKPYRYERRGDRKFRICAVFETDTRHTRQYGEPERAHGKGPGCIESVAPPMRE